MDLHSYLKRLTPGEVDDLAVRCGTTPHYLWKLARGARRKVKPLRPQPLLAIRIERETNHLVRRCESIPEHFAELWPLEAAMRHTPNTQGVRVLRCTDPSGRDVGVPA